MARLDHIVLVHGAAHGAWCWEDVVPLLEARSFRVTAVDLPGLGQDPTPPGQVTLQHYIDCVAAALRLVSCRALLVGHSMGGIAISGAAEAVPEKVGKLLYVAAVLPAAGTAVGGIDLGPDSAQQAIIESEEEGAFAFDPQKAAAVFYGRCPPDKAARAIARLRPQTIAPIAETLTLTAARGGAIPKSYLLCTADRAFPPRIQRSLCERVSDMERIHLATDHSPFYSAPGALSVIIVDQACPSPCTNDHPLPAGLLSAGGIRRSRAPFDHGPAVFGRDCTPIGSLYINCSIDKRQQLTLPRSGY